MGIIAITFVICIGSYVAILLRWNILWEIDTAAQRECFELCNFVFARHCGDPSDETLNCGTDYKKVSTYLEQGIANLSSFFQVID